MPTRVALQHARELLGLVFVLDWLIYYIWGVLGMVGDAGGCVGLESRHRGCLTGLRVGGNRVMRVVGSVLWFIGAWDVLLGWLECLRGWIVLINLLLFAVILSFLLLCRFS